MKLWNKIKENFKPVNWIKILFFVLRSFIIILSVSFITGIGFGFSELFSREWQLNHFGIIEIKKVLIEYVYLLGGLVASITLFFGLKRFEMQNHNLVIVKKDAIDKKIKNMIELAKETIKNKYLTDEEINLNTNVLINYAKIIIENNETNDLEFDIIKSFNENLIISMSSTIEKFLEDYEQKGHGVILDLNKRFEFEEILKDIIIVNLHLEYDYTKFKDQLEDYLIHRLSRLVSVIIFQRNNGKISYDKFKTKFDKEFQNKMYTFLDKKFIN